MQPQQDFTEQPVQQPPNSQQPSPSDFTTPPKPPKKPLLWVLIGVVLFALVGSATYWYTNRSNESSTSTKSAQQSEKEYSLKNNIATDMVWSKINAGDQWRDISSETGVQQFMLVGTRCSVTFDQPDGVLLLSGHTTNEVVAKANLSRAMKSVTATLASGVVAGPEYSTVKALYNDSVSGSIDFAGYRYESNDAMTVIEVYALVSGDYALISTVACGGGEYDEHKAEITKLVEEPKAHITL